MKPSILSRLRNSKIFKGFCAFTALNFVLQSFVPQQAMALTSGPSQPEVQSFEPIGTTDMVNLFSGDFVYNIPLFELPGPNGGYPFNLAYHSGIGMDQEASWVGLGWNLNPGAINRSMRGLPDDFNGDEIEKTMHAKPNETVGFQPGAFTEFFGADAGKAGFAASASTTIMHNNYRGVSYSLNKGVQLTAGIAGDKRTEQLGLGLTLGPDDGMVGSVSASTSGGDKKNDYGTRFGLGIGFGGNSGLNLSLNGSVNKRFHSSNDAETRQKFYSGNRGMIGGRSSYSFSQAAFTPTQATEMTGSSLQYSARFGKAASGMFGPGGGIQGFYNVSKFKSNGTAEDHQAYGYSYLEHANQDDGLRNDMMDFNRPKDGLVHKETPNLPAANMTYDYYSIQGQGTGGMFRPYRTEVGKLYDPEVKSVIPGYTQAGEFGQTGIFTHAGGGISYTNTSTYTGPWENENGLYNHYGFSGFEEGGSNIADYEPVYYKVRGERTSFLSSELDHIGGEVPMKADLGKISTSGEYIQYVPADQMLIGKDATWSYAKGRDAGSGRMPRNTGVLPITNEALIDNNGEEVLKEFNIRYFTPNQANDYWQAPGAGLDRQQLQGHHHGGYSILDGSGMRYTYGLPAYNTKHEERIFAITGENHDFCGPNVGFEKNSVGTEVDFMYPENSDQFFHKTVIPEYAHAYLLTSLTGADYVDVTGNGFSDDDLGYWVKFNYIQTADDFQWRAPFQDARFEGGSKATKADDRASFTYGTKENYLLASAETKTHIAVFEISDRADAFGPNGAFNQSSDATSPIDANNPMQQLDKIKLYTRADYTNNPTTAVPLQTVHFAYDYSLCPNVPNNSGEVKLDEEGNNTNLDQGKLTLKKLWITYRGNGKGALTPYTFDYQYDPTNPDPLDNPNYNESEYDRWGNYKSLDQGELVCDNQEFPYVEQFDRAVAQDLATKNAFREKADLMAGAWHLKKIGLPTGGFMEVEYEADDYAYVQHQEAMQMFKINGVGGASCGAIPALDDLYPKGTSGTTAFKRGTSDAGLRVYFELEHPIEVPGGGSQSQAIRDQIFEDYIQPLYRENAYQLYFKIRSLLRSDKDDFWEDIAGYAEIDVATPEAYGVDETCTELLDIDGSGTVSCFTKGYVQLKAESNGQNHDYHPFAEAAWQHMRINNADLLVESGKYNAMASTSDEDKVTKIKSLGAMTNQILKMFKGYKEFSYDKSYAKNYDPSRSYIRLASPDRVKLGGGSRVKKISLTDQWAEMTTNGNSASTFGEGVYGQVFDYSIEQEFANSTKVVSSGVAQYEPLIGGDEIPMRYAKRYPENIPAKTNNDLFVELPINESYYPGAQVGYRKVSVKSLNTDNVLRNYNGSDLNTSTGVTEHRFYTAKEFPVIVDETDITNPPFNIWIPIPFVGQINVNHLTATQGYSILLNDMHGKPRSIKSFALNRDRDLMDEQVSSVQYLYSAKSRIYEGKNVLELDNKLMTVLDDGDHANAADGSAYSVTKEERLVGVEYEFFTDMRESKTIGLLTGADLNLDVIGSSPPIVTPTLWPSFSETSNQLRTLVTNKIIHKTGIMVKTVATDGLSTVSTKNELFDALTGKPLLTTVKNDFDDPVYNYEYPAHWVYDGMGPAYKNLGFQFTGQIHQVHPGTDRFSLVMDETYLHTRGGHDFDDESDLLDILVEGDEYIVEIDADNKKAKATLVEIMEYNGEPLLMFQTGIDLVTGDIGKTIDFATVRSGRRNHLAASVGSVTALSDPTEKHRDDLPDYMQNNITEDLVVFLNAILCNGEIEVGRHYKIDNPKFYGQDGNHKFPKLLELVDAVALEECNSGSNHQFNCWQEYADLGHTHKTGYHIEYQLKNSSEIDKCHCIARKLTLNTAGNPIVVSGDAKIDRFEALPNGNIKTFYSDNTPETEANHCWSPISVDPYQSYLTNVLAASAAEFRHGWDHDLEEDACLSIINADPNPYATGKAGVWRPWKNYYYKDQRFQHENANNNSKVNLYADGVFRGESTGNGANDYNFRFYEFVWDPSLDRPFPDQWWIPNQTITKYNENGYEVENRDIAGFYSSALYGYDGNLSVAVGANMSYYDFMYESMDDLDSYFMQNMASGSLLESNKAHTGDRSLKVVNEATFETRMKPQAAKKYQLSAWIALPNGYEPMLPSFEIPNTNATNGNGIEVEFFDENNGKITTATVFFEPSGPVVEGWQKVEGSFMTPNVTNLAAIKLRFVAKNTQTAEATAMLFDDIRVFPHAGNMQSYVYDRGDFKVLATLDQNNYATFYAYDDEGNLFLVRKETPEGIKTLQESRSHQAVNP